MGGFLQTTRCQFQFSPIHFNYISVIVASTDRSIAQQDRPVGMPVGGDSLMTMDLNYTTDDNTILSLFADSFTFPTRPSWLADASPLYWFFGHLKEHQIKSASDLNCQ